MTTRILTRNDAGEFLLDENKLYGIGNYPQYETPDVISADTWKNLHGILYNRYQTDDGWKEWDEFLYEGKLAFICWSFHVIQVIDRPDLLPLAREELEKELEAKNTAMAGQSTSYQDKEISRYQRLIARLEEDQVVH